MSRTRWSLTVCGSLVGLLALASPARAQLCGGSHLEYIVRDAKGTPVDAAAKSFSFRGSADSPSWYGLRGSGSYDGVASRIPEELFTALKSTITPLRISRYCTFTKPVALSVTMS